MPYDSNGIFSLNPGYLAVSGQVIQPSQHNPPLEDIIGAGLSNVLVRDGRAPMTGPLAMGGFKITNLLNGTSALDAVNKSQLDLSSVRFATKATNYTALPADNNAVHMFTAAATLSLTAAATLGASWNYTAVANGGDVTVDPNGSETINGQLQLTIRQGMTAFIVCDGSNFQAFLYGDPTATVAIKGYIYGLTLSNNGADATNDIDIAIGSAASDGTSTYLITLASALTKRLDANWAVGTNQGGLDTGSIANTTYHVWLIQRSDTGVVDALFSTSITSPTMPANYDRKRRIGAIKRESAAIAAFVQDGDFFQWMVPTADVATISTTATLRTLRVPAGLPVIARFGFQMQHTSQQATINHWDPAIGSTLPIAQLGVFQVFFNSATQQAGGTVQDVRTNSSGQIYASASSSNLTLYTLSTLGYFDRRGRF